MPNEDILLRRYAGLKVRGLESEGAGMRIAGKLARRGVGVENLTPDRTEDLARARFANVATTGPVGARKAALWSEQWAVDKNTKLAEDAAKLGRSAANEDIMRTYGKFPGQLQAALPGMADSNSPALQALAAQWLAGQQATLNRAMLDIDQNLAREKSRINDRGTEYDVSLLSSIGDTIETLRALEDSKKLARTQQWIDVGQTAMQAAPLFL